MTAREEVLAYALSFADVYTERPFRDQNWQLVRIKGSKKTFLWIYDRGGYLNLNVKVAPEWRDFWRNTYPAVVAGYHQNKMQYDYSGRHHSHAGYQTHDCRKLRFDCG